MQEYRIAVVGGGVFGLASALELARRGHAVTLVDRFGSGHPATSSTGRSRGIRIAYDHPFYVELAQAAIAGWRSLEQTTNRTILHLTGQIDFGTQEKLERIAAAVREVGAPIEQLDSTGVRARFPKLLMQKEETGLFHPDAGTVLSDTGLEALGEAARAAGVNILAPERVLDIETGPVMRVVTERRSIDADIVVLAAGPWTGALAKHLNLDLPLAPAVAQVTFIEAPDLVDLPGIGEWGGDSAEGGDGGVYGHPVPGVGYKLAFSSGQEGWSSEVEEWGPDNAEQTRLLAWLDRRMPSFPRKISRTQRHPWTMTADGDFIVDRIDRVVLACGCSGHAFKFGPALGPLVADVVEGRPTHPLLRFDRKTLHTAPVVASATITR